jgi:acetolactate synthase-1/2/3 large subunit
MMEKLLHHNSPNPDFVKLTESFGALGLRAKTPNELRIALEQGFSANRPTIIEVPVKAFPEPFELLRPTATRGTKG